jgi:hypothetical protein
MKEGRDMDEPDLAYLPTAIAEYEAYAALLRAELAVSKAAADWRAARRARRAFLEAREREAALEAMESKAALAAVKRRGQKPSKARR